MKILYIGTVLSNQQFEKNLAKSKIKMTSAPQTFESAILQGFKRNGFENLECFTFPSIPTFPNGKCIYWGKKKQKLDSGYETTLISSVNLPIIKLLNRYLSCKSMLKKWFNENKEEKDVCVLIYSLNGPIVKSVVEMCKKYNRKCVAFVPDMPKDIEIPEKGIKKILYQYYVNSILNLQKEFDGYLYFSGQMKKYVSETIPSMVVEGVADEGIFSDEPKKKNDIPILMYAGSISKMFGIDRLIEGFKNSNINAQLHIYGSNYSYADELKQATLEDNRIKYMGRVTHEEILKKEREADLLLNLRDPKDEFTKCSFPSKTMEYMASGTPLFTTRLEGIPEEYFDYCFSIDNNNVEEITKEIERIFSLSEDERRNFGRRASDFIKENKTSAIQAKRIIEFISNLF